MGIVSNAVDVIEARKAAIGDGTEVRRLLPQRTLRTIGAWCFLDHYGPDEVSRGPGIRLPPHPHIGLQTVSWLVQGLVLHRDSLGRRQLIRPGELNLMTAGRGITHSEESAAGRPPVLHGLQLWIALPEAERHGEPRFAHHADLPVVRTGRRAQAGPVFRDRRGAVRRAPADVVELRGAFRRGRSPGPARTGGPAASRRSAATPALRWPRRRCLPYPSSHADPFGYWRGAGWLAAGTSGAGWAKTPCWAVSSPAAAAASVMACGDRG